VTREGKPYCRPCPHLALVCRREPPLLEAVLSLSLSPGLARVLADRASVPDEALSLSLARPLGGDAGAEPPAEPAAPLDAGWAAGAAPRWAAERQGSALLRAALGMLHTPRCSEVVR
jgi:U3 small nucleolar RNA-associated protein 20